MKFHNAAKTNFLSFRNKNLIYLNHKKQKQIKNKTEKNHIPDPIIHVLHMPYFSDICSHRRLTQCEAKTIEKSNQQQHK